MMKHKIQLVDLTLCLLWVLAILGSRHVTYNLIIIVTVLFVITRIATSFELAQLEKRSWMPIVGYMLMCGLSILLGKSFGVCEMGQYIYPIFGLEYNQMMASVIMVILFCWLIILPIIIYLILLFKKNTVKTSWSKTDLMGALLWKDKRAKTYSVILLTATVAMLIGLSMNARLCMLACMVAPLITYTALAKHYHMEKKKWWMLLLAMLVFHQAQLFSGIIRLGMLAVTLLLVGHLCYLIMKRTNNMSLSFLMTVYLGVMLPSICIGYNQYACINYARKGFYTLLPFRGIFYVSDSTGYMYGLRDRYGLLLEPQYERIVCKQSGASFWTYHIELHRLGYIRNYNLFNRELIDDSCTIDDKLQSNVCQVINQHLNGLEYADRCQIRVIKFADNKEIANARATLNGHPIYDYRNKEFMPEDSVELESGAFSYDSLVSFQCEKKQIMSYAKYVPNDSVPKYKVIVKLATTLGPDSLTMKNIVNEIAASVIEKEY